ncbi:DUF806 family protein [Sporolactobacillus shoreicorticis]|uniref:DUF806 family protein n=1 Tax=Sporolactobacillus shoreicorticis TaxID=1923877 RepID=A0ABW5S7M6_9BACL|nr:DUF806 family protein [Sporolactobacillus shoreicorticis]MCO7126638.1 DUF806 family protein [Sporolactobacillus shoreicorticis]
MLNVSAVVDLLKNDPQLAVFIPSDHIKGYKIPDEFREITPVVLVTDIRSEFMAYGSDHAGGRYRTVQIQIWFDPADPNIETVELLINSIMENSRWMYTFDSGVEIDQDTLKDLVLTMQFSKNDYKLN